MFGVSSPSSVFKWMPSSACAMSVWIFGPHGRRSAPRVGPIAGRSVGATDNCALRWSLFVAFAFHSIVKGIWPSKLTELSPFTRWTSPLPATTFPHWFWHFLNLFSFFNLISLVRFIICWTIASTVFVLSLFSLDGSPNFWIWKNHRETLAKNCRWDFQGFLLMGV